MDKYVEVGSRSIRLERRTTADGENLCEVWYNCFYRVLGQGLPKIIHNSGTQPSCVQKASDNGDKCQTG